MFKCLWHLWQRTCNGFLSKCRQRRCKFARELFCLQTDRPLAPSVPCHTQQPRCGFIFIQARGAGAAGAEHVSFYESQTFGRFMWTHANPFSQTEEVSSRRRRRRRRGPPNANRSGVIGALVWGSALWSLLPVAWVATGYVSRAFGPVFWANFAFAFAFALAKLVLCKCWMPHKFAL